MRRNRFHLLSGSSFLFLLVLLGTIGAPATAAADGAPIPQDVLFQVLKKQSSIGFEGERNWTYVATDPKDHDISFKQRVLHNPPSDYRVDFLSGLKEGSERHMLAVRDHLYEWEAGTRVTMQERGEDQTLGLVVSQTYLELLRENYTIEAVEGNPVAGRETYLVRVVPRYQGRAAVRVWVDRTWGVPLRMERYDHMGRVELRMEYESITFKGAVDASYFKLPEGMKVRPLGRGHRYDTPETFHAETDRLAPVAGHLPAGFRITEVTASDRGERHSVQTFYSDGYSAFSLFAVQGTEDIPVGKDEPGVRAIESGYRRGTAYVRGWIGDVQITLVSSRLPEYELVRIIPSVRLSGRTPEAVYTSEPPPAP